MNRFNKPARKHSSVGRNPALQIQMKNFANFLATQLMRRPVSLIRQVLASWMHNLLSLIRLIRNAVAVDNQFVKLPHQPSPTYKLHTADNLPLELRLTRSRARIIIEKSGNHWSAWFAETPQQSAGGDFPTDAICQLLNLFKSEMDFDTAGTAPIASVATADHLEFSIPYRRMSRIPKPSVN